MRPYADKYSSVSSTRFLVLFCLFCFLRQGLSSRAWVWTQYVDQAFLEILPPPTCPSLLPHTNKQTIPGVLWYLLGLQWKIIEVSSYHSPSVQCLLQVACQGNLMVRPAMGWRACKGALGRHFLSGLGTRFVSQSFRHTHPVSDGFHGFSLWSAYFEDWKEWPVFGLVVRINEMV